MGTPGPLGLPANEPSGVVSGSQVWRACMAIVDPGRQGEQMSEAKLGPGKQLRKS